MQTIKQWSLSLRQFLRKIFVLFLVTVGAATLFCWYQQWWTLPAYGTALTWAGVLLIGIAGAVSIGSHKRAAITDPHWQTARSASSVSMTEWIQQEQRDSQASLGFTLLFGLTGIVVLAVGYALTIWPGLG